MRPLPLRDSAASGERRAVSTPPRSEQEQEHRFAERTAHRSRDQTGQPQYALCRYEPAAYVGLMSSEPEVAAELNTLCDQCDAAAAAGLYWPALITAMAIIDICGAMSTEKGGATPTAFAKWFDEWVVEPREAQMQGAPFRARDLFTGKECYRFRCSLMHQGRARSTGRSGNQILICEPNAAFRGHWTRFNTSTPPAILFDAERLVKEITDGARSWIAKWSHSGWFARNGAKFARRHPNGLHPYLVGAPLFG